MRLSLFYLITVFLTVLIFFLSSQALGKVSGAIKQTDEKGATINLEISHPAPATAIVTVDIPQGTNIIDSKPKFSRLIQEKNQAQWLLKDIKPGETKIAIRFDKKISVKDLKALIRYKDVASGNMVELPVR